jgi:hypothetical protein
MTGRRKRIRLAPDATERECTKCDTVKPFAAFPLRSNGRPSSWCRECTNSAIREYAKTPEGAAKKKAAQDAYNERNPDYQIAYRYGLKPGEYDALRVAQDDRCAICGTTEPGGKIKRWAVDHCHGSGKVRGLLCAACNMGIGQLGDDPTRLRAAAAYIERHKE